MFLVGSGPESVHECLGHLHSLLLGQGDAAAHPLVALIPVPHIDLRLAAVPCDHVDLLGPLLFAAVNYVDDSDVLHDLKSSGAHLFSDGKNWVEKCRHFSTQFYPECDGRR